MEEDHIEPLPTIGTKLDTAFIYGMGKKGDDFVVILDIDKVFTAEEIAQVSGSEPPMEATG